MLTHLFADDALAVRPCAHWEEGLDEAAEPGRKLAVRLRLPQSLNRGRHAVKAALDSLHFYRVNRIVLADAAGRRASALQVRHGDANGLALAGDSRDRPLQAMASPDVDHEQGNLLDTVLLGSATQRVNAGPRRDALNRGGISMPQMASPQTSLNDFPRHGQQTSGGARNRVKLHWHSSAGQHAVARRAPDAMAGGLSAGATAPGGVTRDRAGSAGGQVVQVGQPDGRNNRAWARLAGAGPIAVGRDPNPGRHFQAALAQAAKAQTTAGLLDPAAIAPPIVTKVMAPIASAERRTTATPLPSGSPILESAGRSGAGTGRQSAGNGIGETGNSAAGNGTAERQGPTQGDVYLDGRLMGRWMAQSLAAEAGRPASGSAGFDPRRNVFPTGAMIGG